MKSFDEITSSISKTLLSDENMKAAFGQPMKLESLTIVPVARVSITAGGEGSGSGEGGGEGGRKMTDLAKNLGGGGKGGGSGKVTVNITPVGFIYEKGGVPTFTELKYS